MMFDFTQIFNFGKEIKAHGKTWLSLYRLHDQFHLAVRFGDDFPCRVFLVKVSDKNKENKGEE